MPRPIKSHVVRGKRYKIEFVKPKRLKDEIWFGECDAPTAKDKAIKIDKNLKGKEQLITILHELLHCINWDACEEAVEESAKDIAGLLWKLGYRLTQRSEELCQ